MSGTSSPLHTPGHSRQSVRPVCWGLLFFLALLYGLSLWRLTNRSSEMDNKFSALAKDQYLWFLIQQNLLMLIAYVLLGIIAFLLIWPVVSTLSSRYAQPSRKRSFIFTLLLCLGLHGFFILRLALSRPYFLSDAEFGSWYYQWISFTPEFLRQALFNFLPLAALIPIIGWYLKRFNRRGRIASVVALTSGLFYAFLPSKQTAPHSLSSRSDHQPLNVLIVASDSLRGDKLGCAGYRPARSDGPAAPGVSPTIDSLASQSVRFEHCYTPIASTFESSVSFMGSQFPHTHGIRQMYPDQAAVEEMKRRVTPMAEVMHQAGYDTSAIGDWCAGYYEVVPLGFRDIQVSSFDNFKIYMSQAVVMAHFVIPLYFDNALGYRIFPQIGSFAQFVTPEVVTRRVEKKLAAQAATGRPFFWHVFYSCNHLPYRCAQPYNQMFSHPDYQGPSANGVPFDIDKFIGGTDLESKWKALPQEEVTQIRALYDGCTRQFDDCVARILKSLKDNGLDQNTIVVVTADHGDDLYEPGVTLGHGLTFNAASHANHIPMIVHLPGHPSQVIAEPIRSIDLMPTLTDLLHLPKPSSWEGRSVAKWLNGTETPETIPYFGETGFPFIQFSVPGIERPKLPPMDHLTTIDPSFNYQFVLKPEYLSPLIAAKQRCLMTRNWKLVCTPTAQGGRHFALYQLTQDESAGIDRAAERPDVLNPMREALNHWIDDHHQSTIREIFPSGEPG